MKYLKPMARTSAHTDESYAQYLQSVEVRNAALRAEQADRVARQQLMAQYEAIAAQKALAAAIEKQAAATLEGKRRPANGTIVGKTPRELEAAAKREELAKLPSGTKTISAAKQIKRSERTVRRYRAKARAEAKGK